MSIPSLRMICFAISIQHSESVSDLQNHLIPMCITMYVYNQRNITNKANYPVHNIADV